MFITLEGIEGSGKTSQIKPLVDFFKTQGICCVTTREPGGTIVGGKIRAILLDPENKDIDPVTELLLYNADRRQHINQIIIPALSSGKTIVCDRYFDATIAYQGYARGLNISLIKQLHELATENLKPDITFLLDLNPEIGLKRAWKQVKNGQRTDMETRFEKEKLSFHEKVRKGYLDIARFEPDRFKIIDASQNITCVQQDIINTLTTIIKKTL